jgi:hypothetical protein
MHFSHSIPNPLTPTLSPEYRGEGEMRETSELETALAPKSLCMILQQILTMHAVFGSAKAEQD